VRFRDAPPEEEEEEEVPEYAQPDEDDSSSETSSVAITPLRPPRKSAKKLRPNEAKEEEGGRGTLSLGSNKQQWGMVKEVYLVNWERFHAAATKDELQGHDEAEGVPTAAAETIHRVVQHKIR
jgi:hypothetical protein